MDEESKKILGRLSDQIDRLTLALEKRNSIDEKQMKCPTCLGDGKGYGGHRCVRCGGSGSLAK
jgi:DnaJ-class molecular chaperone